MRQKADQHPHHAGHRHAGIKVGENAKRGGPQPGQSEFSAPQEKAMRAAGPSAMAGAPPAMPSSDPSMGGMGGFGGGAPAPQMPDDDDD